MPFFIARHVISLLSLSFTLTFIVILVIASPTSPPPPIPLIKSTSPPYTFRSIVPAIDTASLADTFGSAFDPGAIWTYLYQFRDRFPDYHKRCTYEEVEKALPAEAEEEYWFAIVPDGVVQEDEGDSGVRSAAFWKVLRKDEGKRDMEGRRGRSVGWGVLGLEGLVEEEEEELNFAEDGMRRQYAAHSGLDDTSSHRARLLKPSPPQSQFIIIDDENHHQSTFPDLPPLPNAPCILHLDMNLVRALHLSPQLQAAEKKCIDDNPYSTQIYLGLLCTHPDWDGHGFGAAQVEWGMQWATLEQARLSEIAGVPIEVPVTLLATPAGYPLYKSLGFESVENVTFKLLDGFDGGEAWYEYMRWFPSK